jgi:predicted small secreted protein
MRKHMLVFTFLALTVPLLGACHTVQGAGQDVSSTARRLTP